MLDQIRTLSQYKIVKFFFAIFLIIPFGLFGVDYYFRSPMGGDTVASVGKLRVSQGDFDQALRQQQETLQAQFGRNFDSSIMENPEMRKSVLDRVINERLISIGSERAGVRIDDKQLADRIAAEPAFQEDGKFSRPRYEAMARSMGYSVVGLDERLREDMRLARYRDAIVQTAIVPKSTLDGFIRLSEQSREVSVVNIGPEPFVAAVKPTEEQLKAYYNAHLQEFAVPEQVRVEYVELSMDALAAKTPADPEDVKKFYETNKSRFVQREERRASHILLAVKPDATDAEKKAVEAKAAALAAEMKKKPASFAETAKKESQDPGSAPQGGDLGFFARGAMVKPFEEAAFAAKKDEVVGPVRSDFGWHVIRVTDVRPEKGKSLAEAAPEIEAELKKSAAARRFADVAEGLTNMVYEQSTSLKPSADQFQLPIQQSGWFSRIGGAPPILANPKVIAEIFSDNTIKAKRNTAAIEVAPSVLVAARILEHKPAEQRPFDSVRATIEQRYKREEAVRLATADGEAKLKASAEGKDAGLKWPAPLAVSRQKPGGLFPPVLDKVFRADAKKLPSVVGVATPAGYALVRITKVIEVDTIDDAKRKALADRLRQTVAMSELESALASLRGSIGVEVKKDAFEKKATP
ncbi:MAG: SurA N-terminal domain-containing protein [Betaproteobacteria bacterium]|nr:SurA N-terminal domain-containing protein [Betaproteobacteria bacterium]